jgi:hypothetical protein
MRELKLVRLLGAVALLAAAPLLGASATYAQKSPTDSPGSSGIPGAAPAPGAPKGALDSPSSSGTEAPTAPSKKPDDGVIKPMNPSMTAPSAGKGAALDTKPVPGLGVVAADGQRVGEVAAVKAAADGKIEAIHVKTGGMLGFGGRTVAILPGKFTVSGQNVQLSLTSAEVAKLPAIETPQG